MHKMKISQLSLYKVFSLRFRKSNFNIARAIKAEILHSKFSMVFVMSQAAAENKRKRKDEKHH